MRQHYRHSVETDFGDGLSYVEILDGRPVRQIEVCGSTWYWGDASHPEHLSVRPFAELGLRREHAISAEEFERVWAEALHRRRPGP